MRIVASVKAVATLSPFISKRILRPPSQMGCEARSPPSGNVLRSCARAAAAAGARLSCGGFGGRRKLLSKPRGRGVAARARGRLPDRRFRRSNRHFRLGSKTVLLNCPTLGRASRQACVADEGVASPACARARRRATPTRRSPPIPSDTTRSKRAADARGGSLVMLEDSYGPVVGVAFAKKNDEAALANASP